ncbi:LysE family translocator [Aestuariicoccus sp. MJ-SS9]|uniref:LysE family translocator n=1 Tax=Aestuariicoccus sp. MJ-SS9 TaxID=3079855 RepID=UPI00290C9D9A|nr:LysE family transporter [Aestuariicoccus sp. MJ-SS9]MDU8910168.1 LysE family transporter [Aestuariicoccus sp. MJ-SS9]
MGPDLPLILLGWAIAGSSPGPATLAISGTAMAEGRRAALTIAAGIICGSALWGIAAGLGMSALMLTHVWIFEAVRYAGAFYLLYLALKSFRRALLPGMPVKSAVTRSGRLFGKGLLLHVTNPKAILSWGAIYAIALPTDAAMTQVWHLFAMLSCVSACVFLGYGVLFSRPGISSAYRSARRAFDACFALLFGAASLKLLSARLT